MKKVISMFMSMVLMLSVFTFASVGAGAAINAKKSYTSNKSAKQKWTAAYDSFYSGYSEIKDMKISYRDDMAYRIRDELVYARSKITCEFPQNESFVVLANSMKTPAQFEALITWSGDHFGAVVEYADTGKYYGETTMYADRETNEVNVHYGKKYKVGDYKGRESMTITEGLENQLLAQKFSPKTTTARALEIDYYAFGVYFSDGEKAAFYCGKDQFYFDGNLEEGRLYTLEQLSKKLAQAAATRITVKEDPPTGKPVIYLYPTAPTDISVKLGYPQDSLTYTYPEYNGGWNVTAYPDGRIVNKPDKSEHWYLFWEGDKKLNWDFDEGFVVKGSDTERFLREKLAVLGLTTREMNDFITYWAPEMSRNEYNMVSFSEEQYEQLAPLYVSPAPDTVLRVHMVYKSCEKDATIKSQRLDFTARRGFTVVEWGGTRA